ncbi:MAG: LptF/LptG family permease [Lentimicrobiaceae bacterium]|jgi:lipopolysaccharide export system permease protein|nr:LptF/LptG family permease [Lentimicrobiaceae bacterium]
MKKLDIYIIKKFLGTFFYAISMLAVIIIIFDFSEKVDDFLERQAPVREIVFSYYLNFLPYFINLFSALFTFISVIFFTSKLAANTEIVAMLNSGISFNRLLRPYLISALTLSLLSFVLANFVIPHTNKRMLAFEKVYIKDPIRNKDINIHMQIDSVTYVFIESYNNQTNTGYRFSIEKINKSGLFYRLNSDLIRWDSIQKKWKIMNAYERKINGMNESFSYLGTYDTTLRVKPTDFSMSVHDLKTFTYEELREAIAREKLRGTKIVTQFELEKHKRIAFPFATIVLTIIGYALSSRKVRGGIGLHLGLGITISFTFILFMQIFSVFAAFGNMPPFIAVWIPNILFGILGLYLIKKAPK